LEPIEAFTPENWDEKVIQQNNFVLVDFQAPWCANTFPQELKNEKFLEQWGDMVGIGTVDVSRFTHMGFVYRILELPTLILFNRGKILKSSKGPSRVQKMIRQVFTLSELG
jgi:thioredoxin-like negative regulator of GroEL